MKALHILLLNCLFSLSLSPSFSQSAIFSGFDKRELIHDNQMVPYHLFIPQQSANTQKYPLIVALHGLEMFASSENLWENNNSSLKAYALGWASPTVQCQHPAYIVAPHIHNKLGTYYKGWNTTESLSFINQLLDSLIENESIDPNRIYLTGHSMGGIGTLLMPLLLQNRFAAFIPLSSAINANDVDKIKQEINKDIYAYTAIWSFHQKRDNGHSYMRAVYDCFKTAEYETHYTHNFGNEAINLPSRQIKSLIQQHQRYFYTEYTYDCILFSSCHTSVMDSAVVEPLLHQWLFRQYKIDPEALTIASIDAQQNYRITWQAKNSQDSIEVWFKPDSTSDWTKVHQTTTLAGSSFDLTTKVVREQISSMSKIMLVVLNSKKFVYGFAQSNMRNIPTAPTSKIYSSFKIYPTPSYSVIHLDIPINLTETRPKYQIISTTGKVIKQGVLIKNSLNVRELPKGFYLLKIRVGKQFLIKNIIKL